MSVGEVFVASRMDVESEGGAAGMVDERVSIVTNHDAVGKPMTPY